MSDYKEQVNSLREHADLIETSIELYGPSATRLLVYDLRNAADAIEELQQIAYHYEQTANDYWKEACEYKAQLPKRGKWIWIQKENGGQYKGCSVCHAPIPTDSMLDYLDDEDCDFCYSCGAKMEVQE